MLLMWIYSDYIYTFKDCIFTSGVLLKSVTFTQNPDEIYPKALDSSAECKPDDEMSGKTNRATSSLFVHFFISASNKDEFVKMPS